ncbi:restriction endonuclease subunit S [Pseudoalteromonas sp. K222D]|uniref:restriction endonuclease subunit S n=1 Tax=Pseudoalteromonas sp. K222D TaxID=2820756 RepID=UPI001AD6C41A|nr:restriction endonuclease subunit S [Pseudoalteromonas sp. K222D]MBO7928052.1 restriction endonuclease subunit S [Pseudoalteromonas sp. K222D]
MNKIRHKNLYDISKFQNIPSGWTDCTIEEICHIGRGRVISQEEVNSNPGVYPVYSSQTRNNGKMGSIETYDFDGDYITWTTDGENAGTIFNRKGKFNCTNVCGTLKSKNDEVDHQFLAYQLSSISKNYVSYIGNPKLMNGVMANVGLILPTKLAQKKISQILNTVDNLIDQTQNLIGKYTAIKQGMMADLFSRGIDLSGTPETNKNYGQLRSSYAEAPELYRKTELGWVPDGWEIVTLESIATVERGKFTHRPRDDTKCYGGLHPFIQTGSVTKAQGGFITEYNQTLSDFGRNVSKEFPKGTIAVTIAANIADTGILNIPMCFPDSIVGVVVNDELSTTRFVEISIRRNKRRLDALAPLSAQKNINLEDLRPLKIALPNIDEQKELCRRYETQESLIQIEKEYLEKLKLNKMGLMQDLLTGKVPV